MKKLSVIAIFGLILVRVAVGAETIIEGIGMTPTEFTEGFNRAARILRLKPRMPSWPAKSGKFGADVAPGIRVAGVGIDNGNMMSSITVTCRSGDLCNEVIVAAALSADPELSVRELRLFIQRRLDGELDDGVYWEVAGLAYTINPNETKKQLEFHITTAPDEEEDE